MFKRIKEKILKLVGKVLLLVGIAVGLVGQAVAASTNAVEEIQAIASTTGAGVVLATIAGLAIFAAIFIVRKLRSGVNAGAGR